MAFRLLLGVNFLQTLKFTEVSDRLEYLLKKYLFGVYRRQQSPKKKFSCCFHFTDYANRPFTAFTWLQKNVNRQVGTEDDLKTAQDWLRIGSEDG